MAVTSIEQDITDVQSIRRQTSWWRLGATIFNIIFVGGCLLSLNNSIRGLFQAGPRQEQFTSALSTNIQRDVLPNVQIIASRTLAETRPEVEAAFRRLNDRVPEITRASYTELQELQTELPEKGEKILSDTYGKMIASKEQKLKTMFPEATEENIQNLRKNLTDVATVKAVEVNNHLFARHQASLNNIFTSMEKIRLDEAKKPSAAISSDWEMTISIMDIMHSQLHDMAMISGKSDKTSTVSQSKSVAERVAVKKG